MPAAAVIPAPIAYIKVVAVKKLVVGSRDAPLSRLPQQQRGVKRRASSGQTGGARRCGLGPLEDQRVNRPARPLPSGFPSLLLS